MSGKRAFIKVSYDSGLNIKDFMRSRDQWEEKRFVK
jgi:hypothetical protein